MHYNFKKILSIILLLLIVAVNIFTVVQLLKKPETVYVVNLLGNPTSIAVHYNDSEKILTSETEIYAKILEFSEQSYQLVEYFEPKEEYSLENCDGIWIEYEYDVPYKLMLKLSHEIRQIETQRVCVALTGENYGTVVIDTKDGKITVGTLNISTEFINYVKECIN